MPTHVVTDKLPYPFKTKPYAHQLACWSVSKDREAYALFMEMGTGKSKVLIDTAAYQYDTGRINGLLIIAPKGCYQDWEDEHVPIHMPEHIRYKMALWTAAPRKKEIQKLETITKAGDEDLHILIMNVEAFTTTKGTKFAEKFLCGHRALVAVDESTSIKHHQSKRSKNIIALRKFATTRRIMTGDPTANSPLDIYSQCLFLDPHLLGYDSYFTFKSRFANLLKTNLGGRTFMKITGYRDLDELSRQIRPFSFIVKKDECLDLPEKVYQKRKVSMGPKQQKAYDEMKEMSMTILEEQIKEREEKGQLMEQVPFFDTDHPDNLFEEYLASVSKPCPTCGTSRKNELCDDPYHYQTNAPVIVGPGGQPLISTADLVITQLQKLHQIVMGFIKTDDGVEHEFDETNQRLEVLMDLCEELPKAVIWANYRHSIFQISAELRKRFGDDSVVTYFGDTTNDERRKAKVDFKDMGSGVRFFVANPSTGKYGLTLVSASTAIYYSNSYDREERAQSEDRIHRIGQIRKANIVDIICPKTVDEKILLVLRNKQKLSEQITKSNWREWIQ